MLREGLVDGAPDLWVLRDIQRVLLGRVHFCVVLRVRQFREMQRSERVNIICLVFLFRCMWGAMGIIVGTKNLQVIVYILFCCF